MLSSLSHPHLPSLISLISASVYTTTATHTRRCLEVYGTMDGERFVAARFLHRWRLPGWAYGLRFAFYPGAFPRLFSWLPRLWFGVLFVVWRARYLIPHVAPLFSLIFALFAGLFTRRRGRCSPNFFAYVPAVLYSLGDVVGYYPVMWRAIRWC